MTKHVVTPPHKRLLTRAEATAYCGLGPQAALPVRPKRVRPGLQGLRYDVRDLDEWIDGLDRADTPEPDADDWLDRLDTHAQDQRAGR